MDTTIPEGAACMPNLSRGARQLRFRISRVAVLGTVVALILVIALRQPAWVRALAVFIPAVVAIIAFLEARSSVCVVNAARGTFENDDRSKVAMDAGTLPAIRRAATSISVKSVLLAVPPAIVAALTSLIR